MVSACTVKRQRHVTNRVLWSLAGDFIGRRHVGRRWLGNGIRTSSVTTVASRDGARKGEDGERGPHVSSTER